MADLGTTLSEFLTKRDIIATYEASRGYLHFLKYVKIDASKRKGPFAKVAEPWQIGREERVAGALDHLAGITEDYDGPLNFWNGYHKGSDKTHSIARQLCFLLGWSTRRLNLVICASDRDQAALVMTALNGILLDNPWIAARIQASSKAATGENGSELQTLPMDANSGQGIFPDLIICEELTHWQYAEGRAFWDFILGSTNKRPHCILEVSTNAGTIGSWQWEERNRVKESPYWSFYEAPEGLPLPSWMDDEKILDDSEGMLPSERDRLYRNKWVDPAGEKGYLTLEESERCVDPNLVELHRGDRYLEYFISLDYGGVNDRCALGIMHAVPGTDEAIIDRLDCWQGSHNDRIAINYDPEHPEQRSVEGWIEITRQNFRIDALVLDPSQLEGLAILYERKSLFRVLRFEFAGGKGNHRMAQILKQSVQNRKVSWSPQAGLLPPTMNRRGRLLTPEDDTFAKELAMLVTKPMSYGYRFDHESGRHDDRASCIGMGLLHCLPEALTDGPHGPTSVAAQVDRSSIHSPVNVHDIQGLPSVGMWGINGSQRGSKWARGDLS